MWLNCHILSHFRELSASMNLWVSALYKGLAFKILTHPCPGPHVSLRSEICSLGEPNGYRVLRLICDHGRTSDGVSLNVA